MPRRRAGAGGILLSTIKASFFLLPIVLASPHQDQQFYQNIVRGERDPRNPLSAAHYYGSQDDGRAFDAREYQHFRDTSDTTVNSKEASAIATLAPATNNAVRAPRPVQGSGKSAGISPLLHARSLQDWEVEDFVLLATVDGSIHARDRKTGAPRWALEVDRPIEKIGRV
jgi:hypothetical protein